MRKSLIFLFLILWFPFVNTVFAETPLKKVSLIPQWIPQASFAGYIVALEKGFYPEELSLFFFSDFGLNIPEDGLYCMEETFKADPELCARFVQASLKGWLYAFNHEDETVELVMKHADAAHTGTNRAHQRWMLGHMKELIMPGGDKNRLGKLRPEDYTHAGQLLKESGMIDRLPRFDDFYVGSQ